ncbi:YhdH/YhfP family quinone oxidoreductase [Comamonas thiooxydans]|uniref:YhdH/YhfP family quinone oxidoreductase n=1 Tax=Comamonas thiooxydans TaxID=363952 RepID=UPI0015CB8138|nr:YhdH/YhfP family quinone oxidoreductase [Comamonas thiooxydans]MDH1476637.1 YhdH/YhfP family quinone oxidoreductase [Comamonas thiooxydans]
MKATFQALVTRLHEGQVTSALESIGTTQLSTGEVAVRTLYAGVNYKDCLSLLGKAKIISQFPRIAGIEAVGEVLDPGTTDLRVGEQVLVHGFQTGIDFDGGFSEVMRVPALHLQRLPGGLNAQQTAVLGVPGFTVAMALDRFEESGLQPSDGPVAVTGAGGAVGHLAIHLLARAGYQVIAITRNLAQEPNLRRLGAAAVLDTSSAQQSLRPLERPQFAAAIDNVGGSTLSWLLRSMQDRGLVASVGNAGGNQFDGSVLPFIMRRVQLFGVVANATWAERQHLWNKLATVWKPDFDVLMPCVHYLQLSELLAHAQRQLDGATSGRSIVAMREMP